MNKYSNNTQFGRTNYSRFISYFIYRDRTSYIRFISYCFNRKPLLLAHIEDTLATVCTPSKQVYKIYYQAKFSK